MITDARLLNNYFSSLATIPFTEDQKRAVVGFLTLATMVQVDKDGAGRIHVSEFCPPILPVTLRYHPATNPKGARCDI
jgi:DNA-binding transcriptional regulator/RsmH inhibitor MraZ